MDETMRLYTPRKELPILSHEEASAVIAKKAKHVAAHKSKWKRFCDYLFDGKTWKSVFDDQAKATKELGKKYPWFPIMYNWLIVTLILGLFVSFCIWGVNIHTEKTAVAYAEAVAEQKDAEHQAFLAQQEADRLAAEQSLENLMKSNAQVKAKLGYGSRNFIEKYNYSDADFMTLYQCVDNRLKNKMYLGMTIDEIAFKEGQFIASFDTNPVQDYYFNLALKSERLKNERESEGLPEPVGTDYVYAIYTQHGIYLANDPNAPAYTWWRYSE
jgi:hypothetical protein